jgi:hypothetical protein
VVFQNSGEGHGLGDRRRNRRDRDFTFIRPATALTLCRGGILGFGPQKKRLTIGGDSGVVENGSDAERKRS